MSESETKRDQTVQEQRSSVPALDHSDYGDHRAKKCRQQSSHWSLRTYVVTPSAGPSGDYCKLWNFLNLLQAHRKARLSKRTKKEVILFEKDLSYNLTLLSRAIFNHTYRITGYYHFNVYEPKN
ncbi:MAG: hypothetical protein K5752_03195 [Succinivibrionaceae bacterium]|nr:hypothetical protein [Succinivibrionaceae bacterium]